MRTADRELACDEMVLAVAGGGERETYGNTILKLLAALSRPGAATLPRIVGILENSQPLKRRITMIASFACPRRSRWTAFAAGCWGRWTMKKDAPRPTDAPREAAGSGDVPDPPPVPPDPPGDDEEMGGEAPCQLHRFWDVDE